VSRGRRVALYLRISDDRDGTGLGVKRQEEDGRALIERLGWRLVEVYCDNDTSAFSGKRRPRYQEMLKAIETEEADAIVAWAPDRLHRSPRELESFIELIEEFGVAIQTCQSGEWDLSTPSGRAVARTLGAWARYESEHKSARIRRKIQQLVEDGAISNGGSRPYGFDRIFDRAERPRKIIREELHPIEAPVIREMATRALLLENENSLVRDLRQRGIKTSTGTDWTTRTFKRMITSARIAGLKTHNGEVVGKAPWPKIIEPEEHERLVALFPQESTPGGGRKPRKWAPSGLVFCSCDTRMRGSSGGKRRIPTFSCPTKLQGGCGSRSIAIRYLEGDDDTEGLLPALFLKHLEELEAAPETDRQAALEAQIGAWERRLEELEDELADGAMSVRAIRKASDELYERIQANRREIAQMGIRREITASAAELRASWSELSMERKHSLYSAYISKIVILPKGRGGHVFDPARVKVLWK
jgi:site-specific DNA recombinase